MRPASIGKPAGGSDAAWRAWVTAALQQIESYSQQPFLSLIGDVTSEIGGAQIATTIPGSAKLLTTIDAPTLEDTTSLTAAYPDYAIVFDNVVPGTNGVSLEMQVHSGGAFKTTTYVNAPAGATTFIDLSQGAVSNAAGRGLSGQITLYNINTTNTSKYAIGQVAYWDGAALVKVNVAGFWNGAQDELDGFRIVPSAGVIATGSVRVYGLP